MQDYRIETYDMHYIYSHPSIMFVSSRPIRWTERSLFILQILLSSSTDSIIQNQYIDFIYDSQRRKIQNFLGDRI